MYRVAFYTDIDADKLEAKVNGFLEHLGNRVVDVQFVLGKGNTTMLGAMVRYKTETKRETRHPWVDGRGWLRGPEM